jgi:uncharacterized membrane protein YdjX (TVP38/TMEM64 family)
MAFPRRKGKRIARTQRKAKRLARRYWPVGIGIGLAIILLLAWWGVPAGQWIDAVGKQVAELGWAAPFVYVGLFAVGTVVLAPSPLVGIAGGIAFGWWGLPLTILGATAGATASFGISRYIFDVELEDWFKSRRIFQAAKRAIEDEGWKIQILLRLSPAVPFGLLNYLFGLSNTRLITYILSTAIGTLPGNFADTYVGVIGQDLASGQQIAYVAAGAVVTLAGAILITWRARAALKEQDVKA